MNEYQVRAKDAKHFILSFNNQEVGRLIYEKWFSFKAEMILDETRAYQIEPKGFWGTTIELKQHDKVLSNFKMNWNGNIIIHTQFDDTEQDYVLKHKGIFKNAYVLVNTQEEQLLAIQPDFKWSKFNYDYEISATDKFDQLSHRDILMLATIHCVNYFMVMMSGSI